MSNKKKTKVGVSRDLSIDEVNKRIETTWRHRIKTEVIDEVGLVRGPPKFIPPSSAFLDYLEYKTSKPWYKRMFLP